MMRDNWYHHWVAGATLDDQLWHQALVMDRVLESLRGSEQGPNDAMMWTLLHQGVINASVVDKPWNGSTRSMRYSAVLVGRLWGLLAGERTWVSLHSSFQLIGLICGSFPLGGLSGARTKPDDTGGRGGVIQGVN